MYVCINNNNKWIIYFLILYIYNHFYLFCFIFILYFVLFFIISVQFISTQPGFRQSFLEISSRNKMVLENLILFIYCFALLQTPLWSAPMITLSVAFLCFFKKNLNIFFLWWIFMLSLGSWEHHFIGKIISERLRLRKWASPVSAA